VLAQQVRVELEILAGKFLYQLDPELREQLKTFGKQKIRRKKPQAAQKESYCCSGRWGSSLNLEKGQQTFAPFLEATAAPRDCCKNFTTNFNSLSYSFLTPFLTKAWLNLSHPEFRNKCGIISEQ
jgi:hypothetical protein